MNSSKRCSNLIKSTDVLDESDGMGSDSTDGRRTDGLVGWRMAETDNLDIFWMDGVASHLFLGSLSIDPHQLSKA